MPSRLNATFYVYLLCPVLWQRALSNAAMGRGSGGQEGPAPPMPLRGIHVIGPSWKMLNQPPVSPLTLAMTENYCCHQMSDLRLKCTKSFVGWGSAPDPAYIMYILYTCIFCIIGPCIPPYYKSVPRPMDAAMRPSVYLSVPCP